MRRILLTLVAILPAWAGRIDIGSETLASLQTGAQLEITISTGTRPSGIAFQILGPALEDAPLSLVDGSTLPYYSGYRFEGWLESPDRRISIPASRLFLTPGLASVSGMERSLTVLDGFIDVSEGVLMPDETQAVLRIVNLGPAVQFGLGPGYTVRHAITVPGLQGADGIGRSGQVEGVVLYSPGTGIDGYEGMPEAPTETPEPATALLTGAALIGFSLVGRRICRTRHPCK